MNLKEIADVFRSWHRKYDFLSDYVFPCASGRTLKEQNVYEEKLKELEGKDTDAIENLKTEDIGVVKSVHKDLLETIDEENTRLEKVEAKLAAIFALSAISVSIVLSVNNFLNSGAHWSILLVAGYSLLQIIRALFAVRKGLERRAFSTMSVSELVPAWVGSDKEYVISLMRKMIQNLYEKRERVNEKVTQMDIAHVAFRNFLIGVSLLFITSITFSVQKQGTKESIVEVLAELEKYPKLITIFQGPQGLPGERGPKGETGEKGEAGQNCEQIQKKKI